MQRESGVNERLASIVRGDAKVFPPYLYEAYASTVLRSPRQALIEIPRTLSEITGPGSAVSAVTGIDADMTRNSGTGLEAVGQRIVVTGRVLDHTGAPVANTLLEVWQANASGRYAHKVDQWQGTLDPNFIGMGRVLTDRDGFYRLTTIKPGAYPWKNHHNAWRPQHIHFSVFGESTASRLITQMYFPGDPLLVDDPVLNGVPRDARARLVSEYDHSVTEPEWALGYRFNIVLSGARATPFEAPR